MRFAAAKRYVLIRSYGYVVPWGLMALKPRKFRKPNRAPTSAQRLALPGLPCKQGSLTPIPAQMYALAILRYRYPLDHVLPHLEAHRAYLRGLKESGVLLASGPFDPRVGGAMLLRLSDDNPHAALDAVRDGDPFTTLALVNYELLPWNVVIGQEDLDRL